MTAAAKVILPWVVRAIRQPQADDVRANLLRDVDALDHMLDGPLSHLRIEVTQAAEAIHFLLEEIRVDRPDLQPKTAGVLFHFLPIVYFVPRNVYGDAGTDAGDSLHLGGIRQLFPQCRGCPRPVKVPESPYPHEGVSTLNCRKAALMLSSVIPRSRKLCSMSELT